MSPEGDDPNYSSSWGSTLGGSPSKYIISARPEKKNTKLMQPRGEGGAWELGGQGTRGYIFFLNIEGAMMEEADFPHPQPSPDENQEKPLQRSTQITDALVE